MIFKNLIDWFAKEPDYRRYSTKSRYTLDLTRNDSSRAIFLENPFEANSPFTNAKAIELVQTVDIVYKAVDLIATNFANVKLKVVTFDSEGQEITLPNHPLQLLLNKPNGIQSGTEFQYSQCAWRLINGNAYTWLITSGGNADLSAPDGMFALPSYSFTFMDNGDLPWYYQYNPRQGIIGPKDTKFPFDYFTGRSNVIHWRNFNTQSLNRGSSPLQAINTNVNIYSNANEWNAKYFDNGCRLSLAFVVKDNVELSDEQTQLFDKMVEQRFTGLDKSNKPILLENMTPVEMGNTAKDADFIESLKKQEAAIARTLGIPPVLLNSGEGSTFNNQLQAKLTLWDETIIPLIDGYIQELNDQLQYRYSDNIMIVPDYSNVQALNERKEQNYTIAAGASHLTINEKRKLTGQDPIDGGDTLFVPTGTLPLDIASSGLGIFDEPTTNE